MQFLFWGLKSVDSTYFGLFGALGILGLPTSQHPTYETSRPTYEKHKFQGLD